MCGLLVTAGDGPCNECQRWPYPSQVKSSWAPGCFASGPCALTGNGTHEILSGDGIVIRCAGLIDPRIARIAPQDLADAGPLNTTKAMVGEGDDADPVNAGRRGWAIDLA
jgi:hypothetical protein